MERHTQADCCRIVASYLPLWFDEPETMGTAVYWSQRLHDRAAGPSYEVGSGEPIPPSYEGLRAQLKKRDAIIDEAMRLLAAACPESEDSLAVFQGWYDDLAALRARIKEARR